MYSNDGYVKEHCWCNDGNACVTMKGICLWQSWGGGCKDYGLKGNSNSKRLLICALVTNSTQVI